MPPVEEGQFIPAQTVEGESGATPETQEIDPSAKAPDQSQDTEPVKVDNGDNKPQASEPQRRRPNPSEFYEIRNLKRAMAEQKRQMDEMMARLQKSVQDPAEPHVGPFNKDEFFENPDKVLSAREKMLLKRIEELDGRFNTWEQRQSVSERSKVEQEALEILFPKTAGQEEMSLEERIGEDRDRFDKINRILMADEGALEEYSVKNPRKAAAIVLALLAKEGKNPLIMPKKVMGGKANGSPASGAPKPSSLEQKMSELKRLSEEAANNPELRHDETHRSRRDQLIRDIERLSKE